MSLNAFLSICIVIFIVLIVFGFVKYAIRKKYADSVLLLPTGKRKKTIDSIKRTFKYLRIFLWLFPLYLILLPFLLYSYGEVDLWAAIISMMLLFVGVFQEYLFRKWLLEYFDDTIPQQSETI